PCPSAIPTPLTFQLNLVPFVLAPTDSTGGKRVHVLLRRSKLRAASRRERLVFNFELIILNFEFPVRVASRREGVD
ncbi:hypothetical protein, partial [Nostoc sp. UCD121]|uniref:hypothetical protein n=1 Tax=Nostoc sp. UCD121 TaxID=2681305 RepID=UPI001C8A729A